MESYRPKMYIRDPTDEELRRARNLVDIAGEDVGTAPRPADPYTVYTSATRAHTRPPTPEEVHGLAVNPEYMAAKRQVWAAAVEVANTAVALSVEAEYEEI